MGKLTRRMIDAIRQDDPNVLDELWVVSDLLRKGWQPNYQSGFADIDAETVSSEEAGELREVLLDAMHRQAHPDKQRSFLFTLAHGGEQSVKERLVRELHVALEMHRAASGLLWTALIELDHIGEGVFAESPKMSHGIDQVADNIEAAVAYMDRVWETREGRCVNERLDAITYTVATAPDARMRDYPASGEPATVPPGHLFMLGDHRDDSNDSRYFGFVPTRNVIGRVTTIWYSRGPEGVRWERIGKRVQ